MDPVSGARTARESLARGLAVLQTPGLPPQLMSVADPIAQAMSALHRIEASSGAALAEAGPAALAFVRQALAQLQSQQVVHPAVERGIEAVAGSLGVVHQLAQAATPSPGSSVSAFAGTLVADSPRARQGTAPPPTQPSANLPYATRPEPMPQVAYANPPPMPQPAYAPPPQAPAYAPQAPAYAPQAAAHGGAPRGPARAHAAPGGGMPVAVAPGTSPRVEAALGAHSTTNFYKGLAGNDVIESGGIFVATYQTFPIGTPVLIHVSLPGGYEFDAQAVVRWTREAPDSGVDAPPGFGAQFTQISPEGRQLVYRYVRNREPLFHDDF